MKEQAYKNLKIGKYLKGIFTTDFGESYKVASGSLSTEKKNELANAVVADIEWSNMSNEAKEIAEQIYGFIVKHNPKN